MLNENRFTDVSLDVIIRLAQDRERIMKVRSIIVTIQMMFV